MAEGDLTHRMAARRYLRNDPNLLFMKPGAPAASAREYLNPLRGPGASIVSCDHSKPSGSNQPPSSQITTSFGRRCPHTSYDGVSHSNCSSNLEVRHSFAA